MFEDKTKLYFVNEMMYGGTLFERLAKAHNFSEARAAKVVKQILSAISHLHSKGFVHGDIKPENIHFRALDDDILKILDFGTSRRIGADHHMHGIHGTVHYIAPEVLEGDYDEKCDVWSVGVILYMLLSGSAPF